MKKVYKTKKYKKFNKHKSDKCIAWHQHHKNRRRKIRKTDYTTIDAPSICSVVRNDIETIKLFSEISICIKRLIPINVNLYNVYELTPDSILYLLLLIKEAKRKSIPLKGNSPSGKYAFELFVKSGFYNYVHSEIDTSNIPYSNDILRIQNGNLVESTKAAYIKTFVGSHFPNYPLPQLQALYAILIECMSNTNKHAHSVQGRKTWWAMAVHNSQTKKIYFSFIDNGLGIPRTVRKKWHEELFNSDADLIEKACAGKYQKSQTGKENRNQGLPQIKNYCEMGLIDNLVIISNKGYYNVKENKKKILKEPFIGTIISWEFV